MATPLSEWRSIPKPPGMSPAEELEWLRKVKRMRDLREQLAQAEIERASTERRTVRRQSGHDYFDDPVAWVHDCIAWPEGKGPTDYQEEILNAIVEHHKVAVRSLHGAAKTATMSWAIHWFADTRDRVGADWKCVTTASVWDQLKNFLWPEVHKWARMLRWDVLGRDPYDKRTELLLWSLKLTYGQAFAVSPDDPQHIEGAHADELLYIYDESKAVSDETFNASAGAFSTAGEGGTNAYAVAMSTPGEPLGRFYQIHARAPGTESWWTRHVTLDECIRAGRVTTEYVDESRRLWGEDSAIFKNRVLGEFASSSEDGVIPLGWVEAANRRWRDRYEPDGKPVGRHRDPRDGTRAVLEHGEKLHTLGVDVARGGEDKTVFALRQGNTIAELRRLPFTDDTMVITGHVVGVQRAHTGQSGQEPRAIVDVIGVGAGVFDRVREQVLPCSAFNASEGTKRTDLTGEFGFTNCLTGDARVAPIGQLHRIFRSWHDGPLYRVQTAGGDDFTATPNHHVLTDRGWVSVHALRYGDHLVHAPLVETAGSGRLDNVPPTVGEIYRAACKLWGSERVPGSRVDFHGDRPVGKVDVVTVHGDLFGHLIPGREHRGDGDLVGASAAHGDGRPVGGDGLPRWTGDHDVWRLDPRPPRAAKDPPGLAGSDSLSGSELVRLLDVAHRHAGFDQRPAYCRLARSHGVCDDLHRVAREVTTDHLGIIEHPTSRRGDGTPVSTFDVAVGEKATQNAPVHAEIGADGSFRLSGHVATDQVVNVEVVSAGWHGGSFVYTVETSTGAYRSDSAIHKNCRSWAWWNLREMLDPGNDCDVALPPDDRLTGDLLAPRWKMMSGGRIQIESKDDIKKRIGRSTDDGDAVVMAFTESGGSWADLYRDSLEAKVDDGVEAPRQKPSRSGRWDFGAGSGRDDQAPGTEPADDDAGPRQSGPEPSRGGYFAGSRPAPTGPPRSGWYQS